jgi:Rad3-related DNA helicase
LVTQNDFKRTLFSKSCTIKNEKQPGQQYYENLCWKAINQSIGRAIRHQNDYSAIILIDTRYCTIPINSLKEKLPQWIGDSLKQENLTDLNRDKLISLLKQVKKSNILNFNETY